MSDKEILFEAKSLKKYFYTPSNELYAVDDVNMQIVQGQTLGVVGESRCGKSTLGRTILGSSEPNSEQIFFDSENTLKCGGKDMQNLRTDMQAIFQDPYVSLNPRMTVSEAIGQPMMVDKACRRKPRVEKRMAELMDMAGLTSCLCNAYPHELDDGHHQHIGAARVLSLNPKFIVHDEPVSTLNVPIQTQILDLLMDLQKQRGLTYTFITRNLSVVGHISSEIMVMYLGQCIEKASNRKLLKNPFHPYIQTLLDSISVPRFQGGNRKGQGIKGGIVSPVDPTPSCRFAPRCPRATEKCTGHDIPLKNVSENHQVTCALLS